MGLVASRHQGIDSVCIDACVGNFVPNAVIVVQDETLASRDAIALFRNALSPRRWSDARIQCSPEG